MKSIGTDSFLLAVEAENLEPGFSCDIPRILSAPLGEWINGSEDSVAVGFKEVDFYLFRIRDSFDSSAF